MVISGGLAAAKLKQLKAAAGNQLADFGGRLSMRESVAVMAELNLYIGVDTGPTLFAAALGIPSVMLFHCMRAAHLVINPIKPENVTAIDHPLARTFCSLDTPMAQVEVNTVYAAASKYLEVIAP